VRSAFNSLLLSFLGLSLCFCSTFSKSENKDQASDDLPKYENYHSSGVYNDIQGEGRTVSSTEYSDDEYGDVDSGDSAEENNGLISDSGQDADNETENDPLPVEKIRVPKSQPVEKKAPKKQVASVSDFTKGMHSVKSNCTMRAKANTSAKDVGLVSKGKKLWMENHNDEWVKVFKKSGPVYLSKTCL
jgi:hypothetical protein